MRIAPPRPTAKAVGIVAVTAVAGLGALACSRQGARPPSPSIPTVGPTALVAVTADIACGAPPEPPGEGRDCGYDRVARAIERADPDRLLLAGDVQYPDEQGRTSYGRYYDPAFGHLLSISIPVPGDVEWEGDREAYFRYFGSASAPPGGYLVSEVGTWHVIALNSRDCYDQDGCGEGTPQYEWLSARLTDAPGCTLAVWHDPRFLWVSWWTLDGGPRPPQPKVRPFWDLLYDAGAEVIVNGNAHHYERWAPQDPSGERDAAGITEFVVGTGGRHLTGFGPELRPELLVAGQAEAFGFLRLELRPGSYAWRWVSASGEPPVDGDRGEASCH